MQYIDTTDKEIAQTLKNIEKRLAALTPTKDELWAKLIAEDPETATKVFLNAVNKTSLAEIIELEQTDPYLVALREQRNAQERETQLLRAKVAGLEVAEHYGDY